MWPPCSETPTQGGHAGPPLHPVTIPVRDFLTMEPNVDDLFRPKRLTRQQVIVILLICAFGAWMLWPSSHPYRRPPRPAPPPARKAAAPPLYVTVIPEEDSGWCCAAGKLSEGTRNACATAKGAFFAQEAEARRACPTAPSGSPRGRGTGV
jgi:hypothetical protein